MTKEKLKNRSLNSLCYFPVRGYWIFRNILKKYFIESFTIKPEPCPKCGSKDNWVNPHDYRLIECGDCLHNFER